MHAFGLICGSINVSWVSVTFYYCMRVLDLKKYSKKIAEGSRTDETHPSRCFHPLDNVPTSSLFNNLHNSASWCTFTRIEQRKLDGTKRRQKRSSRVVVVPGHGVDAKSAQELLAAHCRRVSEGLWEIYGPAVS